MPFEVRNNSSSRRSSSEQCWTAHVPFATVQTSVGCLTCFSNRWTGCAFAARRLRRLARRSLELPDDGASVALSRRSIVVVSPVDRSHRSERRSCSVSGSLAGPRELENQVASRKRVGTDAGALNWWSHHTHRWLA
jgi:hypothetical protein